MNGGPSLVRIGTRGSELALWQARFVAREIEQAGLTAELVVIKTRGDRDQATPFGLIEGKELFTKEIEDALLERRIDLAVHSLKDLPFKLSAGTELLAIPQRESPLDAWVCPSGRRLAELPAGARVATGSLRRAAQLLALRPDLRVVGLRGNVPTRLEKIHAGQAEAGILAVAGLRRLGLEGEIVEALGVENFTPAAGQGAIAVQARAGEYRELGERLTDPNSRHAAAAERRFLEIAGAGCRAPVGVLAAADGASRWRVTAALATADGRNLMRRTVLCDSIEKLLPVTERLAKEMLATAHPQIIEILHQKDVTANPLATAKGSLAGCTVVLTRPQSRVEAIRDLLSRAGARVISAPAIKLVPTRDENLGSLGEALARLKRAGGWLILPSPSAAEFFFGALDRLSIPCGTLADVRVAVVGAGSARRAAQLGLHADFQPSVATGAALAAELPVAEGTVVLIAGSVHARPELQDGLRVRGAEVNLLALYEPTPDPEGLQDFFEAMRRHPDAVVIAASPSAVDSIASSPFARDFPLRDVRWVAIGPTTRDRLLASGAAEARIAQAIDPSDEAVAQAVTKIFRAPWAEGDGA